MDVFLLEENGDAVVGTRSLLPDQGLVDGVECAWVRCVADLPSETESEVIVLLHLVDVGLGGAEDNVTLALKISTG